MKCGEKAKKFVAMERARRRQFSQRWRTAVPALLRIALSASPTASTSDLAVFCGKTPPEWNQNFRLRHCVETDIVL
jgi:hypothetical protein